MEIIWSEDVFFILSRSLHSFIILRVYLVITQEINIYFAYVGKKIYTSLFYPPISIHLASIYICFCLEQS